jgi:ABC-type multidrug transport system fused ATPase/permease subunit
MDNKTTLLITHQLEAVEHSSQILVFNLGQIVERGNYK